MRVLLVEDEPAIIAFLEAYFERRGHQLTVARRCEDAERTLARDPRFDAVLLDVHLPDARGDEVVRRIVDAHPEHRERTIVMSGDPSYADRHPGRFLGKPFHGSRLEELLDEAASRRPRPRGVAGPERRPDERDPP